MIRSPEPLQAQYRILVVDDNANHSAGIRQLIELQSSHKVVGIAVNGEEAIKRAGNTDIDIVLMDMNMPEVDGLSAIQEILIKKPALKILALTGMDDPDLIYKAMRSGARGYILKTMITSQLMKALDEVAANKIFMPTSIATKFFEEFQAKVQQTSRPDPNRQALLN
jgi:two-component system, NarL family, response regulator DegU